MNGRHLSVACATESSTVSAARDRCPASAVAPYSGLWAVRTEAKAPLGTEGSSPRSVRSRGRRCSAQRAVEIEGRADQRQVSQCLREVALLLSGEADLLGVH